MHDEKYIRNLLKDYLKGNASQQEVAAVEAYLEKNGVDKTLYTLGEGSLTASRAIMVHDEENNYHFW